jgi:hypothetical protein
MCGEGVSITKRTLSVGQEHQLLQKLESAGLNAQDADTIIRSRGNALAGQIIQLVRSAFQPETFVFDNDLSVLEIRDQNLALVWEDNWYNNQDWAKAKGHGKVEIEFQMIDSNDKSWAEQQKLASSPWSISTPQVLMAGLVAYHKKHGRWPLEEGVWTRTDAITSGGFHVSVEVLQSRVDVDRMGRQRSSIVFVSRFRNVS